MKNNQTKEQLLKTAKPILFSTEMVKAILDGRKTQTRRVCLCDYLWSDGKPYKIRYDGYGDFDIPALVHPQYKKGDILYVRETFCVGTYVEDDSPYREYWNIVQYPDSKRVFYKTDTLDGKYSDPDNETKWKPSIHMPKKYARIFLKVTNVSVERLQDIDIHNAPDGYYPEGLCPIHGATALQVLNRLKMDWIRLWNSTAKDGYKWEDNPYVFVYEFERVDNE